MQPVVHPPVGPELEQLALAVRITLTDILQPMDASAIFPNQQPLEIDLGCGDGTFLVAEAIRRPTHNFLGIERQAGRIMQSCRRAARARLRNVRVALIESGYFVRYLLPPQSVSVLHILFPDPWPKRKHWAHRLLSREFFQNASRVLTPEGQIRFVTDDEPYFIAACEAGDACARLDRCEVAVPDPRRTQTTFERRFVAEAKRIHSACWEVR